MFSELRQPNSAGGYKVRSELLAERSSEMSCVAGQYLEWMTPREVPEQQ